MSDQPMTKAMFESMHVGAVKIWCARSELMPKRAHEQDSGLDLRANFDDLNGTTRIPAGTFAIIPTGVRLSIPSGLEAQVRSRSGLAVKHGISVLNSPGTIDAGYTGEIRVCLMNHSAFTFVISHGDRIAQLVFANVAFPHLTVVATADALGDSERGESGYGSTGVR